METNGTIALLACFQDRDIQFLYHGMSAHDGLVRIMFVAGFCNCQGLGDAIRFVSPVIASGDLIL